MYGRFFLGDDIYFMRGVLVRSVVISLVVNDILGFFVLQSFFLSRVFWVIS